MGSDPASCARILSVRSRLPFDPPVGSGDSEELYKALMMGSAANQVHVQEQSAYPPKLSVDADIRTRQSRAKSNKVHRSNIQ